ncbi:MAG: dihydropteroate synthase-like protein [Candidatus Helarchaeales archaeon]
MKKVLVLTGMDAFDLVQKSVHEVPDRVDVKKLPISIAAFMTPIVIEKFLSSLDLSSYEYVMVPGLMKGDLRQVSRKFQIPVLKGPRYAVDIPMALEHQNKLSSSKAADFLFEREDLELLIREIEERNKDPNVFYLGRNEFQRAIGPNTFPIILGEIVDAPKRSIDENLQIAQRYIMEGADVIDIGCMVRKKKPREVRKIIENLKSDDHLKDVPFSIDSLDPEEIIEGVDAGAELILSVDAGNVNRLDDVPREVAVVVLPTNVNEGIMPKTPEDRVKSLIENIKQARSLGFKNVIADPLLETPIMPGLYNSLRSYSLFRHEEKNVPLMFGVGNVTELVDADSVGINVIMACLAIELNVTVLLTTEYSVKSRYSIEELATALKMAFISNIKKNPPKDLTISLFRAKSKKEYNPIPRIEDFKLETARKFGDEYERDEKGYFKIWVDHSNKQIIIIYHDNNGIPKLALQSSSARDLSMEIIKRGLVSLVTHANYLGRELSKAETCLKLGKSYVQDEEIW